MSKHTAQWQIAKSAIAIGAIIAGGFSLYASIEINPATSLGVNSTSASWSSNALGANPFASALTPVTKESTHLLQLIPQGVSSFNMPKLNTRLLAESDSSGIQIPERMSQETMAQMELPADFIPNNADGATADAPFSRINLQEFSSGSKAIALLGKDLNAVAQWYGMSSASLSNLLLSDSTVHLDRKGRLLNIDAGLTQNSTVDTDAGGVLQASSATPAAASTTAAPFPLDQTFKLHTKTSSTRVLYLNFTGEGANPAFSLDAVPSTYSDAERILIQKVWQRVSEDYAPFDVDVTTEHPALPSGKIGMTILITPRVYEAGGYAYLNSFRTFSTGPASAFCFPNNLANSEKPIAECVSHELGHTLGLSHQGSTSTAYYAGQGSGETGWAPIMGVGYYKNLTQWSKGEYANANNKEDAYAIMSRQGLKPQADDHDNSITNADALLSKSANGYNNLSASGVIATPGDIDMFSFVAGAGNASFTVSPAALGGNLDIALQLFDSKGKVLASANADATLASLISFALPAQGTYFLSVSGAGKASALTTGYSNYGSLGQYNITGSSALASGTSGTALTPAPATLPPAIPDTASSTTSAPVAADARSVLVNFDASGATVSGATIQSYSWNFGDGTAAGTGAKVTHIYTKAGSYQVKLAIIDSLGRSAGATMQVVIQ